MSKKKTTKKAPAKKPAKSVAKKAPAKKKAPKPAAKKSAAKKTAKPKAKKAAAKKPPKPVAKKQPRLWMHAQEIRLRAAVWLRSGINHFDHDQRFIARDVGAIEFAEFVLRNSFSAAVEQVAGEAVALNEDASDFCVVLVGDVLQCDPFRLYHRKCRHQHPMPEVEILHV